MRKKVLVTAWMLIVASVSFIALAGWHEFYAVPSRPDACPQCGGRVSVRTAYRCRDYLEGPPHECHCWRCKRSVQSKAWACIGDKVGIIGPHSYEEFGDEPCGWVSREWFPYPWQENAWEPPDIYAFNVSRAMGR